MKRNSMRLLSLVLTLVMLLGAVPFAAADTTPAATIEALPGDTVWEGTSVDLNLVAPTGYETTNEEWKHDGTLNNAAVAVAPTSTTTYEVEYDLVKDGATVVENAKAAKTITVKEKSKSTFAVTTTTAIVGEETTLAVTGEGDSALEWEVKKGSTVVSTSNKFTADTEGDYEVKVTAKNDPSNNTDDKTITATIKAEKATYSVTMSDKSFAINAKDAKMTYTVKKGSETVTATPETVTFTSSNTTVATINTTTGALTLKNAGTTYVTVSVKFADGAGSATAKVTVTDSGVIIMKQDGETFDHNDTTIDLDFEVTGPGSNTDVDWTFEVSTLGVTNSTDKKSPSFTWKDSKESDKREFDTEEDGPSIKDVELSVKKTGAIAMIKAYADWSGNGDPAEGTFYIAVSADDKDIIVTLKDSVDEFDWDDKDVFSAVKVNNSSYSTTQLKTANLADLLTLDSGRYIELDEGRDYRDNKDVGEITNSSRVKDYDNEEKNVYEMEDLEYLTFEAEDDGVYQLEFVQYETITGYSSDFVLGEGTLQIEVGDGKATDKKGDINYDVKNKGQVTLDEDDFEEFWEDYCDEEDVSSSDDDFGYVIFEGYKATSLTGELYGEDGDKSMKNTYKFHFEYDDDEDDSSKDFDLNEVLYKASTSKTNYVDEVDFVCYNEDGEEICDGTLTFTVGEGEKEEETVGNMNFTDVKSGDWYYNAVEYVYTNGIMAGTSTTKFSPNSTLTRGMVVTMLYRVEKEPSVTAANRFSDVKNGDYYYDAVRWAAHNGIVNGVTDTTFAPNTNITREQLAAILYRYADYKKMDTAATKALTGYPDASSVSDYATTAMKWAVTKGIISGDNAGKLNPKGTATRAEAATMFQRFLAES